MSLAFHQAGRSPLSSAIEFLPELALHLLKEKSRFEYRWWGNDLYWYSFDGVVLPCTEEGRALPVEDTEGRATSIEELIVRNERKVGRNEPCPCGSGKKFKHCHGQAA